MADFKDRPRSQRQLQVGETMRQALAEIFLREDFYGPKGETVSVTISEVRISPDLQNATIYYMPLGGKEQDKERLAKILEVASPKIRSMISKMVRMRYIPSLYFKLDDTYEYASRINTLMESYKTPSKED